MPCSGAFRFITLLIISDFVLSLTRCWSFYPFHFSLCGRKFVMCVFGSSQMLQEVHIMEDTLMILPAATPNLQTSRKPLLTMRGHTSFLYTQSLDSIRYLHRIGSEYKTNMFVLEDESER